MTKLFLKILILSLVIVFNNCERNSLFDNIQNIIFENLNTNQNGLLKISLFDFNMQDDGNDNLVMTVSIKFNQPINNNDWIIKAHQINEGQTSSTYSIYPNSATWNNENKSLTFDTEIIKHMNVVKFEFLEFHSLDDTYLNGIISSIQDYRSIRDVGDTWILESSF